MCVCVRARTCTHAKCVHVCVTRVCVPRTIKTVVLLGSGNIKAFYFQ